MPVAQDITISVNATNELYKCISISPVARFQDVSSTSLSGRKTIMVTHRLATQTEPGKTRLKLHLPEEAVVDGKAQVTSFNDVTVDLFTSPDSSDAQRDAMIQRVIAVLSDPSIQAVIRDGAQFR